MHYYKFNIADYRKDTGHLSTLEHGIYRQLIDWQYLDEKPIPLETQVVYRRLRLGSEDEQKSLENVLSEFFEKSDKGYFQKRIRMEIKDYQENADKNRRNGKLGGRPSKTQSVSSGLPKETQAKGNHKPLTINHKPLTINQEPETKNQDIDKPAKSGLVNLFHGVSDEVKNDFIALRKVKKAPVTATAIKGIEREAIKAKLTLEQALEICCSNGWTGFKADWLQKNTKQAESFYERDQRLAAERMAEIGTGLVAAKPSTWTPTAIDDDGTFIPF